MMGARKRTELRRLALFGIAGTVNTATCYALFAGLVRLGAWDHRLALAADYAFGTALGYVLHRVSTFADRKNVGQAFGKYTVTLVATFALNFAILDAIVRARLVGPLAGQAAAMAAVTLASYLAQKHWVFRSHAHAADCSTTMDDQSSREPARRTAA